MENNNATPIALTTDSQDTIHIPLKFDITRRDIVFAFILLGVSLFMSFFGIWGGFKAGFYISLVMFTLTATVYLAVKRKKIKVFPLCCVILSIFVGLSLLLTTNDSVKILSVILYLILNLTWLLSLVSDKKETGDISIIKNIFKPFLKGVSLNLSPTLMSLSSIGKKKNLLKVLLGLACALPVIFIVVPLLMSSDEAFSGMMKMLFGNLFITFAKILWGIVIALLLVSYCFTLSKDDLPCEKASKFKGIENTVLISFFSAVSVCYLAYLFSQSAYFFSAFSGFLPDNYEFTVSGYARRGFFEMSIIAGINLVLIFSAILLSKKNNGKSCVCLRILCCFIGIFTLIIIATAISKMVLYISSFGMTLLRIQTTAFMIFLCVVFIALIIRLFLPKIRVLRVAFITAAAVLVILGSFNVNSLVARYNYNAYKSGDLKDIDVYTIYELGYEGVPYLIKLTNESDWETSRKAADYLFTVIDNNELIKVTDSGCEFNSDSVNNKNLGDYSLPESVALKELEKYIENNWYSIYEQYMEKHSENSIIDYFF